MPEQHHLVTGHQLELAPLTKMLCILQSGQISIHLIVHLLSSYLTNLTVKILWEMMPKVLLKSMYTTSTALLLWTKPAIWSQKVKRLVRYDLPLLIHIGFLPHLLDFLRIVMDHSHSPRKIKQLFWALFSIGLLASFMTTMACNNCKALSIYLKASSTSSWPGVCSRCLPQHYSCCSALLSLS